MTTHIFLDVDGVLNAVRSGTPSSKHSGWNTWRQDIIMGYRIWHSPEMVREINTLASRDDVQFNWLTTWQDHAVHDLSPVLGIESQPWPVLYRGASLSSPWWKAASLAEHLEVEKIDRFVWIDDDHDLFRNIAWFEGEGERWMRVSPVSNIGLTRDQLTSVTSFLDSVPVPVLE